MSNIQLYSHQLRYRITLADYHSLRTRLSAAKPVDITNVHTLRFASYQSLIPAQPRQAEHSESYFSLHYYDGDPTYLLLERRRGQERTSAMVAEAECRALLSGETDWLLSRRDPVLQDFYDGLTERMLLPQVMMSYHQEAYTLDGLDLWVALDTDIRVSLEHMDFLDPELLARDTAGQQGQYLLEIGYSCTIPDALLCILEETAPRRKLISGSSVPEYIVN